MTANPDHPALFPEIVAEERRQRAEAARDFLDWAEQEARLVLADPHEYRRLARDLMAEAADTFKTSPTRADAEAAFLTALEGYARRTLFDLDPGC
jgi:hypothetical protein